MHACGTSPTQFHHSKDQTPSSWPLDNTERDPTLLSSRPPCSSTSVIFTAHLSHRVIAIARLHLIHRMDVQPLDLGQMILAMDLLTDWELDKIKTSRLEKGNWEVLTATLA